MPDRSLRDNHGQSFFTFPPGTDLLSVSAAEVSPVILYIARFRVKTNYQQSDRSKMVSTIILECHQSLISLRQYFPAQDVMLQSLNTVTISKLEYENLVSFILYGWLPLEELTSASSKRRINLVCKFWYLHRIWLTPSSKTKGIASERGSVTRNSWCKPRCCKHTCHLCWHVAL